MQVFTKTGNNNSEKYFECGVIFLSSSNKTYAENGVYLSKSALKIGDTVTLTYDGLLATSGADNIFAHVGYGHEWEHSGFIPMEFENGVFKANFKISLSGSLNISFKDSANNWDNNSLKNYVFEVAAKAKSVSKKAPSETKKAAAPKKPAAPKKASAAKKTAVSEKTADKAKPAAKKKATAKGSDKIGL